MDQLDRLAEPAADLLGRVDELLADLGAPAGHRIWSLVRRLGALPGEAVAAVAVLHPTPFAAAGGAVRALRTGYEEAGTVLDEPLDWQGRGAAGYEAHRAALAEHLAGGAESLTGRLDGTAGYADAVADWVSRTRLNLARTLAEVLGSAEAVAVVGGGISAGGGAEPGTRAAAEIGAAVLATLASSYDEAESISRRWAPARVEASYRGPTGTAETGSGVDTRFAF